MHLCLMLGKRSGWWTSAENLALAPSSATSTTEHLTEWAEGTGLYSYPSINHSLLQLHYSLLSFRTRIPLQKFSSLCKRHGEPSNLPSSAAGLCQKHHLTQCCCLAICCLDFSHYSVFQTLFEQVNSHLTIPIMFCLCNSCYTNLLSTEVDKTQDFSHSSVLCPRYYFVRGGIQDLYIQTVVWLIVHINNIDFCHTWANSLGEIHTQMFGCQPISQWSGKKSWTEGIYGRSHSELNRQEQQWMK